MPQLNRFLLSGFAIDMVLVIVVAEAVLFAAWWRRTRHGLSPHAIATLLAPGVCLLLALRVAVMQGSMLTVAVFLSAAFVAHLVDVATRWDKRS